MLGAGFFKSSYNLDWYRYTFGGQSRGMRNHRTAVVVGIVVLIFGVLFAVGFAYRNDWFHGRLPSTTLASSETQAEDVAFSIASNVGCGEFDGDEAPNDVSASTWQFDCEMGDVSYRIFVYCSDQARSAGLAGLQADGRPFVAKAYYAVTTLVTEAAGQTTPATPPPASVLDPFR
jgi:hypothetical protein